MKSLVILAAALVMFVGLGPAVGDGRGEVEPPQSGGSTSGKAATLTPDALDRLHAPIALYPDQLLAHMFLCAQNPGKVAALGEWLAANSSAKGTDLQDAATKSGFEPSFVAMTLFPDVVNAMASDLEWTTQLGQAFAADRTATFASIQRLRGKAKAAGTLKSTQQQDVETRTTSSGEQVIVIEPANPQVVYVPQYNPQVVYTESSSSSDAVAAGLIGFTAGIAIGAAIDNDYYYGPYGWGGGAYMYNDAWDDWYDEREDMREDWQDHREDLADERGDRARDQQEQRTERQQTQQQGRTERQQTRQQNPEAQAQREQRRTDAQAAGEARKAGATSQERGAGATTQQRSAGATSQEARGYSRESGQATRERSGTSGDAFSGYSSGRSERAASQRGQRSRSNSRGGGSRRR